MEKIKLLDCTLRDGGYINDWKFGKRTIKNVILKLVQAKTDYIEVGFLRDVAYDENRTLYNSVSELKRVLPEEKTDSVFVAMALHNQYDLSKLEENDGTIGAIRVTFHDYDIEEGLEFCRGVKEKGYPVFVNPINIMGYSDPLLLKLLEKVNELMPYGFSIVDTFGSMTKTELLRIYSLLEHNLDQEIVFGVHLHENMALSFSLAQVYLEVCRYQRKSVLDASLNGMGRVPGNLCMELMMDFLNRNYGAGYDLDYVLDGIEEHIMPIKRKESWGYQTEYFLSAKYNLHRNYAEYLQRKGNLTTKEMKVILKNISEDRKTAFDEKYIEKLYREHENRKIQDDGSLVQLKNRFENQKVLLLAPGRSLHTFREEIQQCIQEEQVLSVTTNFYYEELSGGFAFFSNERRLEEYQNSRPDGCSLIVTSNLAEDRIQADYRIDYERLVQKEERCENSGILLLRLMEYLKPSEVLMAGFDGFQEGEENYLEGYFGAFPKVKAENNKNIARWIQRSGDSLKIRFLTPSRYEKIIRKQES